MSIYHWTLFNFPLCYSHESKLQAVCERICGNFAIARQSTGQKNQWQKPHLWRPAALVQGKEVPIGLSENAVRNGLKFGIPSLHMPLVDACHDQFVAVIPQLFPVLGIFEGVSARKAPETDNSRGSKSVFYESQMSESLG